MIPNAKVARQAYRVARQSELANFTKNVFTRMNGVADYAPLQPLVDTMATLSEKYQLCLGAARNRGQSEILAKKLARIVLLKHLDQLAKALEELAGENVQLIVDAGFNARQSSALRYTELPAPTILRVGSTGRKGEVRVVVDDGVAARSIVMHAMEYSLDRNGWNNGTYHSRCNFVATGLPHAPELWVRLKSLGTGGRKSEWSEPVAVAVL